jgi:hypothetical protein
VRISIEHLLVLEIEEHGLGAHGLSAELLEMVVLLLLEH